MKENRHAVFVSAAPKDVLAEIVRWGEAGWWPKRSLMRFSRREQGPVTTGTRYRQEVLLPFAPSWDAEVIRISSCGITRRFLNGMFEGEETVAYRASGSRIEVTYAMTYEVRGLVNRLLWRLIFRRLHDENIALILKNLKAFLEKTKE